MQPNKSYDVYAKDVKVVLTFSSTVTPDKQAYKSIFQDLELFS